MLQTNVFSDSLYSYITIYIAVNDISNISKNFVLHVKHLIDYHLIFGSPSTIILVNKSQTNVEEHKQADQNLLQGDTSVSVVTESFEVGVNNPNISQVIRIGCPHARNLGVLF